MVRTDSCGSGSIRSASFEHDVERDLVFIMVPHFLNLRWAFHRINLGCLR